jgi:hypothetical protein
MKTNSSARYLVRMRVILVCAALAAIVGLELSVGASLAARMGQTAIRQTASPVAPSASLSDLMMAAR